MKILKDFWAFLRDFGKPGMQQKRNQPYAPAVRPTPVVERKQQNRDDVDRQTPITAVLTPPKEEVPMEQRTTTSVLVPASFEKRLESADTVESCLRLYQNQAKGSSEEVRAEAKLLKLATSFQDWFDILDGCESTSTLAQTALSRLQATASSFSEWKSLLEKAESDAEFRKAASIAVAGMAKSASDIEDWTTIYLLDGEYAEEKRQALERISALANSEKEWQTILDQTNESDPVYERAFNWRLEQAQDLDDLEALFDNTPESEDRRVKRVLEKMEKCGTPLDDWVKLYENRSDLDKLTDLAIEKALSLAKTPDDFNAIIGVVGGDDKEKVEGGLNKTEWNKDQWTEFRDNADSESNWELIGFRNLLKFETTVTEILTFLLDYKENWTTDDDFVSEILEKLFSQTTPREMEIIRILSKGTYDTLFNEVERRTCKAEDVQTQEG